MKRSQQIPARALAPGVPVRTCVGCRQRDEQPRLFRVALVAGQATPDPRRRLPGRGAYLHRRAECVERAARTGGVSRGLRARVPGEQVLSLFDGFGDGK